MWRADVHGAGGDGGGLRVRGDVLRVRWEEAAVTEKDGGYTEVQIIPTELEDY